MSEEISPLRHSKGVVSSIIIESTQGEIKLSTKVHREKHLQRHKTEHSQILQRSTLLEGISFSRIQESERGVSNRSKESYGLQEIYRRQRGSNNEGMSYNRSVFTNKEEEKRLRGRIVELQAKIKELKELDTSEKDQIISANKDIIDLGQKNDNLRKSNLQKDKEIQELKKLLRKSEKVYSGENLKETFEKYKQENDSLSTSKKHLEHQIVKLRDEQTLLIKDRQQRINAQKTEIDKLQSLIHKQSSQIQVMKKTEQHLKQQKKVIREEVTKYRDENTSLLVRNSESQATIELLQTEQRNYIEKCKSLEEMVREQKQEIFNLKKQVESKNSQGNLSLVTKQEELRREIVAKDEQIQRHKLEYTRMDKELKDLIGDYKKLIKTIEEHRKHKSEYAEKDKKVAKFIDGALRRKVVDLRKEIQNLKLAIKKDFSTNITALKANISKDITEGVRKFIEGEVDERVTTVEQREKGQRAKLQGQIATITKQKEELSIQLNQSADLMNALRKENNQLTEKVDSLILQLKQAKQSPSLPFPVQKGESCLGTCPSSKRHQYWKILFTILFFQAITLSVSINLLR